MHSFKNLELICTPLRELSRPKYLVKSTKDSLSEKNNPFVRLNNNSIEI